jgi:hypothetical protein
MRRFPLSPGSIGLILTLLPAVARAQISPTDPNAPERNSFVAAPPPPAPPQPSAWERVGMSGFELQLRVGVTVPEGSSPVRAPNLYPPITGDAVGDILRGKESPYGPDFLGLTVALGYRIFPWLSVGASFSYATFNVLDGTDTGDSPDYTSQLERQYWSLAAYGRYYFVGLSPRLQPWVELGFGYSDDNANYYRNTIQKSGSGGPELQQYLLEDRGLLASLTAGLDWRLAPVFSVGPSVGYSRIFPLKGCVTVNVDSMSPVPGVDTCSSSTVSTNGYGLFFAGAFVKLTFDPWLHR